MIFSVFWVICPFIHEGLTLLCFWKDWLLNSKSLEIKKKWTFQVKMWVFDPQNTKIVFLGSKTHFFISDTYIFHSELICYVILHPQNWFIIIPDIRKRLFRWKNGYLTPKTWFLVFFGSYAHVFMRGTHFFVSERIHYWI